MTLDAVLFDIDGTLLDTNDLHVAAWRRAFEEHGYKIATDRIQREIGKGGDKLVPAILGDEQDQREGEALRELQPEIFKALARAQKARVFPGAAELLAAVRRRGLKVVLATSSRAAHVKVLKEASGFDLKGACDALVTADEAAESKPAPDLVVAAVNKLGMTPAQCAMVGDTLYDMEAAKHAGVIGLGVLTGYQPRRMLVRSGARAVWPSVKELHAELPEALRLASPSELHPTLEVLEALMHEALIEARCGLEAGEAPIGCVLADGSGRIVARGHNQFNHSGERTAHAEMMTFRASAGRIATDCRDHILVSTLEPCVMCTGAAMEAAIDTIVYALEAPADSGTGRVMPPESPESQMPRIVQLRGALREESRALFRRFLGSARDPLQRAFAEQLLELTGGEVPRPGAEPGATGP